MSKDHSAKYRSKSNRPRTWMADKQSVVVTGVSTGIGWGITKVLIANGFTVFGSVRRQSDADRLQREFGEAFTPLTMDVTDRQVVEGAAAQVSAQLVHAGRIGQQRRCGSSGSTSSSATGRISPSTRSKPGSATFCDAGLCSSTGHRSGPPRTGRTDHQHRLYRGKDRYPVYGSVCCVKTWTGRHV